MDLRIREFEWDEGNALHLELGHGITLEEAESVFASRPFFRKTKKGNYVAMGPTSAGRYVLLVFQMKKGGLARVITGWDMNAAEVAFYRRRKRQ